MTVTVLGMGDTRMRPGHIEFHIKVWYLRDWLKEQLAQGLIKPDDLVVFLDGYDVIVRGDKAAILQAWQALGSPDIVLSGERYCWPDREEADAFDKLAQAAGSTSEFRYLCSGMYAGKAGVLSAALNTLPELAVADDDQRMWTRAFKAHGARWGMKLDRDHVMLPSANGHTEEEAMANTAPLLHLNGSGGKTLLDNLFRRLYPMALQPGDVPLGRKGAGLVTVKDTGPVELSTPVSTADCSAVTPLAVSLAFVSAGLLVAVVFIIYMAVRTRRQQQ